MSLRDSSLQAAFGSLTLAATCWFPALAQISPGKLSAPHEKLEGNRNCLQCHDAEHGVSPQLCLDCHDLLRERVSQGKGLHARSDHKDCRKCHIEHHGKAFQLIWWGEDGRADLDHARTGYALEGAHADLGCRNCHRKQNIRERDALLEQGKDLGRTFLGLDTDCLACHTDVHEGQYQKTVCRSCHSMTRWKPADLFDHATTDYPLLGRHREVACAKCHLPGYDDPQQARPADLRFLGIAAERCTDCHFDEHRGQFNADSCTACHTPEDWRPKTFDHDRSAYPLTGRHLQVECRDCHLAADPAADPDDSYRLLRGIAHDSCADCHEAAHKGRLGASCVACHATGSWRSTKRNSFDHGLTRFPLEAKHQEARCEQCHAPGASLEVAQFDRCVTCHRDIHLGQFQERTDGGACEACHTVEGFVPSQYTVADHQRTAFPIEGAHATTSCDKCHRLNETAEGAPATSTTRSTLNFEFGSASCSGCHADPHRGILDRFMTDGDCGGCHDDTSWVQVEFDHDRTRFPLKEAHLGPACAQCHRRWELDGAGALQWVGFGTQCTDCHADPHRGQFDREDRAADCRDCHRSTRWNSLLFLHERDSAFPLGGAHARARCEACHYLEELEDGAMVRFRPLPSACVACHKPPRRDPGRKR